MKLKDLIKKLQALEKRAKGNGDLTVSFQLMGLVDGIGIMEIIVVRK